MDYRQYLVAGRGGTEEVRALAVPGGVCRCCQCHSFAHSPGKVSHVSYAEGLFPRLWGHLANGDIFPHSELFGSPSVSPCSPQHVSLDDCRTHHVNLLATSLPEQRLYTNIY